MWPGAPRGECFDAIATLAFLASCTERINLLVSAGVVPNRPAVLAAKLPLTADVPSGSRVVGGVGVGWMREARLLPMLSLNRYCHRVVHAAKLDAANRTRPGGREMFSGTVDDMLADVTALRQAGVRHVVL